VRQGEHKQDSQEFHHVFELKNNFISKNAFSSKFCSSFPILPAVEVKTALNGGISKKTLSLRNKRAVQ